MLYGVAIALLVFYYLIAHFTERWGDSCSSKLAGLPEPKGQRQAAQSESPTCVDGISYFSLVIHSLFDIRHSFWNSRDPVLILRKLSRVSDRSFGPTYSVSLYSRRDDGPADDDRQFRGDLNTPRRVLFGTARRRFVGKERLRRSRRGKQVGPLSQARSRRSGGVFIAHEGHRYPPRPSRAGVINKIQGTTAERQIGPISRGWS